jgi:hypothetical protein
MAIGGMQFNSTTADIQGMAALGILPIVEETPQQPVWQNWGAAWRDLYILDANSDYFQKINLTYFDPDPSVNGGQNYAQLRSMFVDAASVPVDVSLDKAKVGKKRKLEAHVTFNSGLAPRDIVSPFQKPKFAAITVALADLDGDGIMDGLRFTARLGKKKVSRLVRL